MKGIITTQEIRLAHPGMCDCATDLYYTRFANRLFDSLRSFVGKDLPDKNFTRVLARKLTSYFEDIVADMGVWHSFSDLCMKLYGYPVPMYHAEEEYYPDEPSLDAVRYLIWDVANEMFPDRIFETDRLLQEMGQEAYRLLSDAFEQAPINEDAKKVMDDMLHYSTEGFNELRNVLDWVLGGCYITSGSWINKLMGEKAKEMKRVELFESMTPSMKQYFVITGIKFEDRIGPLALNPYEWLQQLAETTGNDDVAAQLKEIEVLPMDTYQFTSGDEDPLTLENTHGKVIKVSLAELNLKPEVLKQHNGCVAGFVFYKGEWRLNGVLVPLQLSADDFEKVKAQQRDIPRPGTKLMTAEMLLKSTGGRQLVYFKDAAEMKQYLQEKLKYPDSLFKNSPLTTMESPCMFIDTVDKVNPQFFTQDLEQCIKDPDNPYYDAEKAKEDAVNILWNAAGATSNMVNYLIDHELLPDAEQHYAFSQQSTHGQRLADMNFYMRYNRRSKY